MATNLFTYELGIIIPGMEIKTESIHGNTHLEFIRVGRQKDPIHLMSTRLRDSRNHFRIQDRRYGVQVRSFVMSGSFWFKKDSESLLLKSEAPMDKTIFVLIKYRNCELVNSQATYVRNDFLTIKTELRSEMFFLIRMEPGAEVHCWNTLPKEKRVLEYENFPRNT